ncbi:MAG: hypothetical protein PHI23_03570 [Candidatus Peribacteraceae bacterium]|nr:hypothetical protein [Candidatus Peribacteraceae bacterium]
MEQVIDVTQFYRVPEAALGAIRGTLQRIEGSLPPLASRQALLACLQMKPDFEGVVRFLALGKTLGTAATFSRRFLTFLEERDIISTLSALSLEIQRCVETRLRSEMMSIIDTLAHLLSTPGPLPPEHNEA